MTRPAFPLTARWNKDLSISIYCAGRKVERFAARHEPKASADAFMTGWFGTPDKAAWRVRWIFA